MFLVYYFILNYADIIVGYLLGLFGKLYFKLHYW